MSKSTKLKAARKREQKWAMLGTSYQDWMSRMPDWKSAGFRQGSLFDQCLLPSIALQGWASGLHYHLQLDAMLLERRVLNFPIKFHALWSLWWKKQSRHCIGLRWNGPFVAGGTRTNISQIWLRRTRDCQKKVNTRWFLHFWRVFSFHGAVAFTAPENSDERGLL